MKRNDAILYRTKNKKYEQGYGFLSSTRKYKEQLLGAELDASKKVVHKAGEYLGNKTAEAATVEDLIYMIIILRNKNLFNK